MNRSVGILVAGGLFFGLLALGLKGSGFSKETTVAADLKNELMEADRAFARATKAKGIDGWMSFMTDDAVRLSPLGGKAIVGKAAVRELDAKMLGVAGRTLQWEPVDGGGFADGKHGFTTGKGRMVGTKDDGSEETVWSGVYVTMWRKNDAGQWKVILDTGAAEEQK